MAKNQVNQVSTAKKVENIETNFSKEIEKSGLPFGKSNYTILLIGIAVLFLGFFIMTLDKEEFGFGFMGITLGPIIVFLGFLIPFYALFKKK